MGETLDDKKKLKFWIFILSNSCVDVAENLQKYRRFFLIESARMYVEEFERGSEGYFLQNSIKKTRQFNYAKHFAPKKRSQQIFEENKTEE